MIKEIKTTDAPSADVMRYDLNDISAVIPPNKLDADQFAAEDLDGVTESIFSSGNMSYASLQASQTEEALRLSNPYDITLSDTGLPFAAQLTQIAPSGGSIANAAADYAPSQGNGGIITDAGRPTSGLLNGNTAGADSTGGNFTASTVGSVGASTLSSDLGRFASTQQNLGQNIGLDGLTPDDVAGQNGTSGQNGTNGTSGASGTNGANGTGGQNGEDGTGGGITIDIDLTEITENLTQVTEQLIDITQVTEVMENLLETITTITNSVTNIINDLLNLGGDLPVLTLDLNVLDALNTDLTVPLGDLIATDLNLSSATTPLTNLLDNLGGDLSDATGLGEIGQAVADLTDTITALQTAVDGITGAISDIALNDLNSGINGLLEAAGALDETVTGIATSTIENTLDILNIDPAATIGDTLDGAVADLGGVLGDISGGATDDIVETLQTITEPVTDIVDNIVAGDLEALVGGITDTVQDTISDTLETLGLGNDGDTLGDIVDGVVADLGGVLGDVSGGATDDIVETLQTITEPVTDIVDNVVAGDLEAVVGGVGDVVEDTISDTLDTLGLGNDGDTLGDIVDGVVADLGNTLGDVSGGATDDVVETLQTITDPVTDIVDDAVAGDLEAVVNTVTTDLADTLVGDLGGGLGGLLGGGNNDDAADSDIDVESGLALDGLDMDGLEGVNQAIETLGEPLNLPLDPVEDLVGDLDLGLGLHTDLLSGAQEGSDAPDTDGTVTTGIDIVDVTVTELATDIPLDTVEQVVGDLDLNLGFGSDLFGNAADPVVNEGEGGTGEDTLLAQIGDSVNDGAETIVTGDLSDVLEGVDFEGAGLESLTQPIDSITQILGDPLGGENGEGDQDTQDTVGAILDGLDSATDDLNLDLGDSLGLLDGVTGAGDGVGGLLSGDDGGGWTESTLGDSIGLFDDVIDGGGGLGGGDVLPDPVGSIAEGLGALDIPQIPLGNFGGLFG